MANGRPKQLAGFWFTPLDNGSPYGEKLGNRTYLSETQAKGQVRNKAQADEFSQKAIPYIVRMMKDGLAYRQIAAQLNETHVPARGGKWAA